MLKITFSDHAIYQMKERNLKEKLIKSALRNPDKTVLQFNFRKRAYRRFKYRHKNYLLIVIYEEQSSNKKIITAFVTSKTNKYLND